MTKKVVIVGAGPSGVLLAHYLLRRGDNYQVDIYERRNDPRVVPFSISRTYGINLTERALNALRKIKGMEEAVKAISVEIIGSMFHQKNGKTRFTPRKKTSVTLDRTKLVSALLDKLSETYDHSRLNIHFNHNCIQADFAAHTVTFQKVVTAELTEAGENYRVDYDLLVGADGAKSVIRQYFLNTELFDFEQQYVNADYKSIFLTSPYEQQNINLKPGYIHYWGVGETFLVMLFHRDGSLSGVIILPHNNNEVVNLATGEEVLKYFQENFPEVGQLMSKEEAEAFLTRPITRILSTRCSRYHHDESVLLIGDAAHAVSPTSGQGCNAALEDVVVFDQLLDKYSDNLSEAIPQYTIRRKADAYALVELSRYAFPSSPRLFIELTLRQSIARLLHKIFPKIFPPALSEMLFESTASYSEIWQLYKGWISKVKKYNEKLREPL